MPGPWEKYAQQQAPWEKYTPAPTTNTPPPQPGFLGSFADSSGLTSLGHLISHPIDTVEGIPAAVRGAVSNTVDNVKQGVADYKKNGLSETTRRDFGRAVPIVGPALAQAQAQHDAGNDAGMAGTLAGTVAGLAAPAAAKEVLPAIGPTLTKVGEASQDAGVGLLNKTAGMLKADFKRGTNGARGYFEAGNGPALSMQSLADKAAKSKVATGQAMSDLRQSTPVTIPYKQVEGALMPPLAKARELELGPGGLGNTASIDAYEANLKPTLNGILAKDDAAVSDLNQKAGRQVLSNSELRAAVNPEPPNPGVSPDDIYQMKRSIAQNTNWSDPTQFNLKAVRQQQAGALGGLLNDNIPGYGDLAERYGDLKKFAERTQSRAETHSSPLTALAGRGFHSGLGAITGALGGAATGGFAHAPAGALGGAVMGAALDSVPVKSTLASGLYYGGKGVSALGDALPAFDAPPIAPAAYYVGKAANGKDKSHR